MLFFSCFDLSLSRTQVMLESTSITRKSGYQRNHPAGFLENMGVKYYQTLAKKAGISDLAAVAIDDLPSDDIMCSLANSLTHFAAIIAFSIGALTTVVSVWFEWEYAGRIDNVLYYSSYLLLIVAMLVRVILVRAKNGTRTCLSDRPSLRARRPVFSRNRYHSKYVGSGCFRSS
jgi:hypothetical protein